MLFSIIGGLIIIGVVIFLIVYFTTDQSEHDKILKAVGLKPTTLPDKIAAESSDFLEKMKSNFN